MQCTPVPDRVADPRPPASLYDTLVDYFRSRQNAALPPDCRKLFVLTENGCASCNKKLLNQIEKQLSDPCSAFLIAAQGGYLDISHLPPGRNVFIDQNIMKTGYRLFHQSKIIFLTDSGIDTIVNITAANIQKEFETINGRNQ